MVVCYSRHRPSAVNTCMVTTYCFTLLVIVVVVGGNGGGEGGISGGD